MLKMHGSHGAEMQQTHHELKINLKPKSDVLLQIKKKSETFSLNSDVEHVSLMMYTFIPKGDSKF